MGGGQEPKDIPPKYPHAGKIDAAPDFQGYYTLSNGCPIEDPQTSDNINKVGANGKNLYASQLVQDLNTIDTVSHITRERIPERYVHAKGAGAFGEFKVTKDLSQYTDAKFLQKVGQKTRLFVRFSTVAGEKGSADTVRDTKGAAFKLYTEEGNLDWLLFNPEMFLIRDPAKFPSLVHATKRDPKTNLASADMFWDFFNHNPEAYNALIRLFTNEGTPKSYSKLNYFGVNTYTFTKETPNADGRSFYFVRIKITPDPAIDPEKDYFTLENAVAEAGKDPDFLTRDLYEKIQEKKYPKWKVWAQIIDPGHADKSDVNIFDATRAIPEGKHSSGINFDWTEFGEITLNEPPQNFFSQVEQSAFNVANIVPGWDISPDPILQIRLFAYGDTQRYRVGANHDQLPVNRAPAYVYTPTRRDGAHSVSNYADAKNYVNGCEPTAHPFSSRGFLEWQGIAQRFKTTFDYSKPSAENKHSDWYQPWVFWNAYVKENPKNRDTFVGNVTALLGAVNDTTIQQKTVEHFTAIDDTLGKAIKDELVKRRHENKKHEKYAGVIAGGQDRSGFVPPTVPDPATDVDPDTNKAVKIEICLL